MRIVYLSPSSQLGGAEASLLDVLSSVRSAQPEWSLHLVTSAEGPLVGRAQAMGVETNVLRFPASLARVGDHAAARRSRGHLLPGLVSAGPAVAGYVRELRRVLGALSADLVHSNGLKMHILGAWARPAGVPLIWHIREYVSSRPAMSRLLRWNAARCATAVGISRTVADDVKQACGDRLDVQLVYNAIDTHRFHPEGRVADLDALARMAPAPAGTVRVGLPATLAVWKGQPVFLQALARLPRSLPVRGYVLGGELYEPAGSQSSLQELRTLARDLGVADRVGFTGFVDQPAAAMRALDVVVHASTRPEPFGRVIAEAMACGRPVIASDAGGAAEIVRPGIDALVHAPGSAEALAQCISELASDAALRDRLGTAGRESAERRFDRARLATELLPIYSRAWAAA